MPNTVPGKRSRFAQRNAHPEAIHRTAAPGHPADIRSKFHMRNRPPQCITLAPFGMIVECLSPRNSGSLVFEHMACCL